MRLRRVVDLCSRISARRAIDDQVQANSLLGVVRFPRKRIMGWRPCWRILVAFMVMGRWSGAGAEKEAGVAAAR